MVNNHSSPTSRNAPPASSQACPLELGCSGSSLVRLARPGQQGLANAGAPTRPQQLPRRCCPGQNPFPLGRCTKPSSNSAGLPCGFSACCFALCLVAEPSRDPTRPRSVSVQSRHLTRPVTRLPHHPPVTRHPSLARAAHTLSANCSLRRFDLLPTKGKPLVATSLASSRLPQLWLHGLKAATSREVVSL